jgi:RNA polymerase sigma-70 factor (ECF subfamily)
MTTDDDYDRALGASSDMIRLYFLRRIRCRATALDLCSSTTLAALESRADYDEDKGSVQAWMFGIARHQLAMWHRRERAHSRALRRLALLERIDTSRGIDIDASPDMLTRAIDRMDSRASWEAARVDLACLPEGLRQTLYLRVVEQLPYAEVARRVGCTEGAARVRVMRSLRSLRASLVDVRSSP